jgi:hypothetical protein
MLATERKMRRGRIGRIHGRETGGGERKSKEKRETLATE